MEQRGPDWSFMRPGGIPPPIMGPDASDYSRAASSITSPFGDAFAAIVQQRMMERRIAAAQQMEELGQRAALERAILDNQWRSQIQDSANAAAMERAKLDDTRVRDIETARIGADRDAATGLADALGLIPPPEQGPDGAPVYGPIEALDFGAAPGGMDLPMYGPPGPGGAEAMLGLPRPTPEQAVRLSRGQAGRLGVSGVSALAAEEARRRDDARAELGLRTKAESEQAERRGAAEAILEADWLNDQQVGTLRGMVRAGKAGEAVTKLAEWLQARAADAAKAKEGGGRVETTLGDGSKIGLPPAVLPGGREFEAASGIVESAPDSLLAAVKNHATSRVLDSYRAANPWAQGMPVDQILKLPEAQQLIAGMQRDVFKELGWVSLNDAHEGPEAMRAAPFETGVGSPLAPPGAQRSAPAPARASAAAAAVAQPSQQDQKQAQFQGVLASWRERFGFDPADVQAVSELFKTEGPKAAFAELNKRWQAKTQPPPAKAPTPPREYLRAGGPF